MHIFIKLFSTASERFYKMIHIVYLMLLIACFNHALLKQVVVWNGLALR